MISREAFDEIEDKARDVAGDMYYDQTIFKQLTAWRGIKLWLSLIFHPAQMISKLTSSSVIYFVQILKEESTE